MIFFSFPFRDFGTRSDNLTIGVLKAVSHEIFGDNCLHMAFGDVDSSDLVPGMTTEELSLNLIALNEGGT